MTCCRSGYGSRQFFGCIGFQTPPTASWFMMGEQPSLGRTSKEFLLCVKKLLSGSFQTEELSVWLSSAGVWRWGAACSCTHLAAVLLVLALWCCLVTFHLCLNSLFGLRIYQSFGASSKDVKEYLDCSETTPSTTSLASLESVSHIPFQVFSGH